MTIHVNGKQMLDSMKLYFKPESLKRQEKYRNQILPNRMSVKDNAKLGTNHHLLGSYHRKQKYQTSGKTFVHFSAYPTTSIKL